MTRPRHGYVPGTPKPEIGTRGGSHKAIHDARLAQLVEGLGLTRLGFYQAVVEAIGQALREADLLDDPDKLLSTLRGFVPDAYEVDHERQQVRCWEVVVGSPPLASAYAHAFYVLDEVDWLLRLFYIDGRTGAGHEIDVPTTAAMEDAGRIVRGTYMCLRCEDFAIEANPLLSPGFVAQESPLDVVLREAARRLA